MVPYATFIIPTYNRAGLLPAAIASLLAQTSGDLEVIVVDDGSTDDTPTVIQPYLADERVRYAPKGHLGRSAARNYGVELARGSFIGFLDSDDRQLAGALETYQKALAQNPALPLIIGGYEYIDESGRALGQRRPWTESRELGLCQWVFNCFGVHGAFLLRRDWFERVQGYDVSLPMAEDWDLFLRLAQAGCPMGWVEAVVCQYRQHHGSSIRSLAQHRDCSLLALKKVFTSGSTQNCAELAPQAEAWVHVNFARRGFAAGYAEAAQQDLEYALALDPGLAEERRLLLLESLLSPEMAGGKGQSDTEAAVLPYLPAVLARHAADVRRARARVHMAAFFRARDLESPELAGGHLRAALRYDGRWLINRGVLAFCARQALARAIRSPIV